MKNFIYLVVSALIVIFISFSFNNINVASKTDEKEKSGIETIKELQSKNVEDIEGKIGEIRDKYKVEIIMPSTPTTQLDYKMIFKDDIFMGDSQTEGLTAYGFLNESSVLAEKGKNVVGAMDYLDSLKYSSPENVYLLFGLNDMLIYNDVSNFIDDYIKLIEEIKRNLPNTKIYVQSVMIARDDVIAKQPMYSKERNAKANELLEAYCKKSKIEFINLKSILENNNSLFEADGLHVKADFYRVWLSTVSNYK